jgi:replicative DNA helicase
MLGRGSDLIYEARAILAIEDFWLPAHQMLFSRMLGIADAGKPIDPVTLADALTPEECEEMGGVPYMVSLMEAVPHASHLVYYCEQVQDVSRRRKFHKVLQDATEETEAVESLNDLICTVEGQLHAILEDNKSGEPIDLRDVLEDVLTQFGAEKREHGMPTGYAELDKLIRLEKKQLIVIAARPSMGKTGLGMCLALNAARDGKKVFIATLEQSRDELTERMWSSVANISNTKIRRLEPITETERMRLMETAGTLSNLPIYLDDTNDQMSVARIGARARIHKRRFGLDLLMIDYLQLIEPESRKDPREQQVARMSRSIKILSKSLDVPILLLCQLNREVEKRPDRRPRLGDLRESGSIEQDCDVCLLIHRPEFYDPQDRPGEAEIIVAKNRSGKTGSIWLQWSGETTTFRELSHKMPPSVWSSDPEEGIDF